MMRRRDGYVVMELLVVLAILAVFVGVFASRASERAVVERRELLVDEYVKELPVLTRAVRAFVASDAASFAVDTVRVITLTELTTAGLLPASFAARPTGAGTTPMGHAYRIAAIRSSADNRTRTVISEAGGANIQRLAMLNYVTTGGAPLEVKRDVATKLASAGLTAAYLLAGNATARDAGSNGWTRDVAAWVPTAGLQAGVTVLLGFPELEPIGGPGVGGGGGPNLGRCRVQPPGCSDTIRNPCPPPATVIASTPASGMTEEGRWPHCISGADYTFYPVARNSAVITLGAKLETWRTWTDGECQGMAEAYGGPVGSAGYQNWYAQCISANEFRSTTDVFLNNGIQSENVCSIGGYRTIACGGTQCLQPWRIDQPINPPTTDDIFVCEP